MEKQQIVISFSWKFYKAKAAAFLLLSGLFIGFSFGFYPVASSEKISEGIIEFKCTPVKPNPSAILPQKMVFKFKNNYSADEQEAGLSFAKMKYIADPVKKEFHAQIWFFIKQQSLLDSSGVKTTNHYLPDYDVEYGTATKEIAGYKCHNAILKFKNGDPGYEVWFTREIDIEDPNWANPYYKINGVLLDYRLKRYGLDLQYTATSVSTATINDDVFTVPAEYKMTPNAEIERMFEGFYTE